MPENFESFYLNRISIAIQKALKLQDYMASKCPEELQTGMISSIKTCLKNGLAESKTVYIISESSIYSLLTFSALLKLFFILYRHT